MCEWLSQQEWSDVRLRCGGRSLPAHRAVLASASAFLRRLLLSSGTEETPTFIVLPDFDLEAMSSVLYYIYNGEVVIQKQKIEMFMEIVKAMQIFVDEDYLPSVCRDNAGVALASNVYSQTNPDKSKVFSLGSTGEGAFINIKRDVHIEQLLVRNINNDKDSQDKEVRFDNGIQQPSSDTESVGDRQRSCFRRDLFVETYPRNGNANGRATRVLAIPNSCYRAAASVLSANANDKHRVADDFSSEMQKTTDALPNNLHIQTKEHSAFFAVSKDNRSLDFAAVAQFKNLLPSYTNPKLVFENNFRFSLLDNYSLHQSQILSSRLNGLTNNPLLNLSSSESSFIKNPFKTNKYISESPLHDRFVDSHYNESRNNVTKCNKSFNNLMSKGAILNQVMESPWCPRQPTNYRPSLRKPTIDTPDCLKENTINDTNNNPKIALSPENVDKNLLINGTEEPNPDPTISASDLKCAVCNQVFTDSESLSTHARRHSAPARYSCTECSKSFSQLRNFKYHMSIHRGTREFAATCTVCGKYFNDRGYLSSHMKIHRNRKEYKCSQCPKSFNQRVAYNMHVRIHTGIKPHVCGECGKAFSRKMLLKQHQRTHSGERPYACSHCDKRFADRSNMTLHLRLHSGIKPFSCTLCPKSFTKKHHLKSHLNFHTGSKPYSCPRCNLAFTQSSNMRTHYKKCTAPVQTNNAERPAVP